MTAMIARAALTPEDAALLASVRKALSAPWADPVLVRHVAMSRSTARAIERDLARRHLSFNRATPSRRVGVAPLPSGPTTNTAPRSSRQPTLARGCEAEPAACDTRRGDKRKHRTLPMVRKGETLFHGETCA